MEREYLEGMPTQQRETLPGNERLNPPASVTDEEGDAGKVKKADRAQCGPVNESMPDAYSAKINTPNTALEPTASGNTR